MLRALVFAGILLASAVAFGGIGDTPTDLAPSVAADGFCGGGGPGEPCHCPDGIGLPGKDPIIPIYC